MLSQFDNLAGSPEEEESHFANEARVRGMKPVIARLAYSHGGASEQKGYELFMDFWKTKVSGESSGRIARIRRHPVLRHSACDLAAWDSGPRAIAFGPWANKGIVFPYHLPITRVEFDSGELADRAVEMMNALVLGREPASRYVTPIPGQLVKGFTA